ncbi:HDOD domain-containing protein [Simiduia sp. 21SJ11W-1]|uniref:HDOD domain-containing protein n=1 Tax=Simiduia sp. 21SJ11W-1 TaxID=2909669 RepID=UPI0020A06F3C|nr:HDOD domain-containing protein [Simiduia sp. 21SJ11W-1]UTA48569.1 HDOD domain-containing protein [Simiduia sp. 21SJ11W-1]
MTRSSPKPIKLGAPKGAAHWHKNLSLAGLTLLPGSFERIQRALAKPNSSAAQVGQAIAQDPAACLHFFLRANRLLQASGNELHGLSHLVSLLGFPQVTQILNSLPVAEGPLPAYWRQLQQALLRAALVQQLPLARAGLVPGELYFAALFSQLDQWLLWHQAPEEKAVCDGLSLNPHIGPAKAQALVFGTALEPWLNAALRQQPLPLRLREALALHPASYRHQLRNLARTSRQQRGADSQHRPAVFLGLIAGLTRSFAEAPGQNRCLRAQQWLATLLHCEPSVVTRTLHTCAANLPVIHAQITASHPARRLVCQWPRFAQQPVYSLPRPQQAQTVAKPQIKPEAKANTGNSSADTSRLLDNRFHNATRVRNALQHLTEGAEALASLNDIFTLLASTLADGIGMQQGGLLVRTQSGQWQLKCSFDQHNSLPQHLPANGLLAKLLEKPAALLVNADNRAPMLRQLPDPLADSLGERDALFISLFLGAKPVAILFASEADLTPPRLAACKRLAQAAQKSIARLARNVQRRTAS